MALAMAVSLPPVEQKILLSVDGSEQSEAAVKYYLERLHRPGNKLIFVHCIELPELNLNKARDLHMSPGVLADLWKEEEQKTKLLEERMKGLLREKGVAGVLKTTSGKPGEAICRLAEEENAAMIIVAMRGMGKVRRTILGSVSDYLIHHAHCPVVVCRHPSKSRHSSGSDSKARSRHASGPEFGRHSRHASGDAKSRHASGDANKKSRHASGDSMSFRQRIASWGRSFSFTEERSREDKEADDKENQEVAVTVEQVPEVVPASAPRK